MERKKSIQSNSRLISQVRAFLSEEKLMLRNTSKLFSSRILVIVIALVLTPVISRIYTPTDYGHFSIYSSITQVLVVLGTLAYPLAILSLPLNKSNLAFRKSIKSSIISAVVLILIFYIVTEINFEHVSFTYIKQWWWLFPIGFLASAILYSVKAYQQRQKAFGRIARSSLVESGFSKLSNIVLGLLGLTSIGLVISDILSRLVGAKMLSSGTGNALKKTITDDPTGLERYPKIALPSELLSILSSYLIIWFMAMQYSITELGKYWLALGLTSLLLHSLTNSLQPVVTQRIVDRVEKGIEINPRILISGLFLISLVVFAVLICIPDLAFVTYLGEQWIGATYYVKILSFWYVVLLVDQVLENIYYVQEKDRTLLLIGITDVIGQLILISVGWLYQLDLFVLLIAFVVIKLLVSIYKISRVFSFMTYQDN